MEADASLMEVLEGIYDPRNARGKRHPLPALLALAVVAMLAGMTSYEAIVDYCKERGGEFLRLLGFTRRRGLCKATYSRVFRRIDVVDFEARVGRWIPTQLGKDDAPHLSIDGKTARGSRDGSTPGVHLVSAYTPDVKAVLAQLRVGAKTNEHKAALELLWGAGGQGQDHHGRRDVHASRFLCEGDRERVGDAGDGHREEHRHLRLQPAGLQERRGRHASLRLPPKRDTGNPVKTNLRMKRPCPQAISLSDQSLQNESIWEQWRLQPIPTP